MLGLTRHTGTALIDSTDGRSLDFPELCERARSSLAPMGSDKRILFVLSDNALATTLFYTGALLVGHAVALLDGLAKSKHKFDVLKSYRAPWIAGPIGTSAQLAAEGIGIRTTHGVAGGELIRTAYPETSDIHPDLALLLATSGTTGSRKFVRLSRRNVEVNAVAIAECLALSTDDRPITSLPLHYTFGLSVLNSHWLAGAPVVLSGLSFLQKPFWEAFEAHECTGLAGVPFSFQMLERIGFRKMELPNLAKLQQAGGALGRKLKEVYHSHMLERSGALFVMYGQTEATARMSYVPPDRLSGKLDSAGIAIPGGSFRIETNAGITTQAGAIGEVIYQGPNVMMGYAESPGDLGRGDDLDGVLRTGDVGYLDDEDYLFLVGRSKRIAKVFGVRISLDEIELRLRETGPAAVLAEGEKIRVFCAYGDEASLESERMRIAKDYKIHHSALCFDRVEEIPTSSSGKIDYERLERWL